MRLRDMIFVGGLMLIPALVRSQEVTLPACETQVQEQYRHLSTAGLVPQATALQWGPQLAAIVKQVRIGRTTYEIKENQAKLAEQNVAQLLDQLREAQDQVAVLRAEVERLKGAPTPSN